MKHNCFKCSPAEGLRLFHYLTVGCVMYKIISQPSLPSKWTLRVLRTFSHPIHCVLLVEQASEAITLTLPPSISHLPGLLLKSHQTRTFKHLCPHLCCFWKQTLGSRSTEHHSTWAQRPCHELWTFAALFSIMWRHFILLCNFWSHTYPCYAGPVFFSWALIRYSCLFYSEFLQHCSLTSFCHLMH